MGTARSGHLGVQLLDNGKVLISGGTSGGQLVPSAEVYDSVTGAFQPVDSPVTARRRSEEHTSELQSQSNLVCRLLLEKKKKTETQPPCSKHTTRSIDVVTWC